MNILHIETATTVCSVALSINGVLRASRDQHEAYVHASKLTVFIQEMLDEVGMDISSLHAVSVSKGPGSYTGLRIGVSVAKGICYALDIPLISVHTLEAMLTGFLEIHGSDYASDALFCPMIDARRMEVYSAVYTAKKKQLAPIAAQIIELTSFDTYAEQPIVLFGEGANKFETLFASKPQVSVFSNFLNIATYQVAAAVDAYQQHQFEDVAYFEPYYLKDFIPTTPKKPAKN